MTTTTSNDSPIEKQKSFLTVGIGASAGGITPLKEFFAAMPADSGMAFVVILHLSPQHESHLAAILQTATKMPVTQVNKTLKVEPNHVYVIPPTKYLVMQDGHIRLTEPEKTRGKHLPIDLLFRTMADAYEKNCIAIVMSGTGSDGTLGLKRVKDSGGICVVQDPKEAEFDGMPANAINTGLVDLVLPIGKMPQKLQNIKRGIDRFGNSEEDPKNRDKGLTINALSDVLLFLKKETGHDFENYKRPTLLRRLTRRMQVHGLDDIPPYLTFLQNHPEEAQVLLRDLLISVTNFFRDKQAFAALEETVIPKLFRDKTSEDNVRAWCVACATGEEAYSLAMLFSEYAANLTDPPTFHIFATDIDEPSLAVARAGRYPEAIAMDVPPERLRRFFTKDGSHYVVNDVLRKMVLFAPHNILRDPPFSQQDLVICRNLLIYLNRGTQETVFDIFHFSLRPNGMMFLGASETAESAPSLFSSINAKHRIYQSRPVMVKHRIPMIPVIERHIGKRISPEMPQSQSRTETSSFAQLHGSLIERFAWPSVLVDENYNIVHISGNAASYLQFPSGEPTRSLLKSVYPSLKENLLATLFAARKEQKEISVRNIRIDDDAALRFINITVQPVEEPAAAKGFFLVIFDELKGEDIPSEVLMTVLEASDKDATETVIDRLEEDLSQTQDRLRLIVAEQEATVENLKASNEELQAMNEELRSTTEELETGREELQSVNEEMVTVNQELKENIQEVSRGKSDLQNLIASSNIGTLFLDHDLQIKLFTPAVQQLFNIIDSDIGRPLAHLTHKLDNVNLLEDAAEVLRNLQSIEREARSEDDRWYVVRLTPYRTSEDRIGGVVITFIDFTRLKQSEADLAQKTAQQIRYFETSLASINELTCMLDREGRFCYSNKPYLNLLDMALKDLVGKTYLGVHFPAELATRLHHQVLQVIETKTRISDEASLINSEGIKSDYEYAFSPIFDEEDEVEFVVGSSQDITGRKRDEESLREADRRKDVFLATLAHELRNPLAPIRSGVELIRRSNGDPKITERTMAVIERQTNRIVHLVDDLLEVSRITQGKITLRKERFDLKTTIEAAAECCAEEIATNKHQLIVSLPDEPIYIKADIMRMEQVLTNLLANASKYTPTGGKIWLTVSQTDAEAVISVRDNGMGLAPDRIVSIFEMFNQVEGATKNAKGGLGIGLGVVEQLVEMHGGSVSAASDGPGKGTEFTVRLPLSKSIEPTTVQPQEESKMIEEIKPPKKKVLIIDDNKDVADMMKTLLSMEGHEVRVTYDGETGIEAAKEYQPDVCLCDIGLPKMDGYEAGKQLRQLLPNAKLIAFSGWGQDSDKERSKEAGFDEHMVKGSGIDKLTGLIG